MNDYTTAGLFYNPSTAQTVLNIPPNMKSGSFSLLVEPNGAYGNGCKQTITDNNQGITDTRVMSDVAPGHWSEWKTLATATPPQEFNLSLAEDITTSSRCVYWKNQFDEVTVICDCNIPEGVSATAFAALPAGFRPAARCIFNASMWESGSARSGGCSIDVFPNGQLDFYSGGYTPDIRIWGLCKFVAVS